MQSTCRFLHHFIGTSGAIRCARLGEFVFKRLPALKGTSLKNYTKAWRGEGGVRGSITFDTIHPIDLIFDTYNELLCTFD